MLIKLLSLIYIKIKILISLQLFWKIIPIFKAEMNWNKKTKTFIESMNK